VAEAVSSSYDRKNLNPERRSTRSMARGGARTTDGEGWSVSYPERSKKGPEWVSPFVVVIYDNLRWAETPSSLTGYIIWAGKPRVEVRREVITLCVIITEEVGRCGRCLRKGTHFFRTCRPVLILLHLSGTNLHHRFRFVDPGAGPFGQLTTRRQYPLFVLAGSTTATAT
jgi:hypothetical protein